MSHHEAQEVLLALLDPNRSLWVATTDTTDYAPLTGEHDVDVAVVGGGITGLTAALLLLRRGASVTLLEGSRIAAGTTGYTTAKITSLHSLTYAQLVKEKGPEKARLYGEANQAAIEQIATLVEELGIDCQLRRAPAYTYTLDPAQRQAIEDEVAAAESLGLPATFTTETDLPYGVAAAVRFDNQAHFHPRQYALVLARAIEAAGGRIFEHSRTVDIDEGGGVVVVRTEDGEVRAQAAVVATLLPFLDIGGFFAKAHPSRSYALAARCRGAVPQGMYISVDSPTRSIRPVDLDGAPGLVLGGSSHKPGDADDTEGYYRDLEAWALETFDVEAVEQRWSAQDYVTIDQVPYIGRCPRTDRVFVGTGYKKWGMTGGTVAGMIAADLISDRDNPWVGVFDATRVGDRQAAKRFVKENAQVGAHFVKDRVQRLRAGDAADVAPGDGGVVRIDGKAVGVYRDPSGELQAVSVTCTHMGCTLNWNRAEKSWDCPCHGSRFTSSGEVIEGPATQALERVTVDGSD
ncbi:MAG: FAD-dependent oxidoreductase [Actinomycetota bacterium]|nr:FAD-dependent oxidoreductase [Actinomycetota bacterium]